MGCLRHLPAPLRRFGSDTGGVSAVEFALILPFMLLLLLGSFDLTRVLDARTKLSILSRTVSDFISQEKEEVTPQKLANVVTASSSVMYPFSADPSVLAIRVESIRKNEDDEYEVDWSYQTDPTPTADGENRNTDYVPTEDSVIRTTVTYVYRLKFAGFLLDRLGFDEITLTSSTAMSPRSGQPVEEDF